MEFFSLQTRTYVPGAKFDDINLLWKTTKLTFLCFFTNKNFFSHKSKVDSLKKFLKWKWCLFFDLMHFRLWPAPSGGFLRKIPNRFGFHFQNAKIGRKGVVFALGLCCFKISFWIGMFELGERLYSRVVLHLRGYSIF